MSKPWVQRVLDVVFESDLGSQARLLLAVMAVKADQRTASGFTGQQSLAALTGLTDRYVRQLLAELEVRTEGPRIARERRYDARGGRSTDRWTLIVPGITDQPEHHSGRTVPASRPTRLEGSSDPRHTVPVSPPELGVTPTGTVFRTPPEQGSVCQGSGEGSYQGNVHPRPVRSEPTRAAEPRTDFQESDPESGAERTCPSNLLALRETVEALARWARKLPSTVEVLNAAGREFVDYYTRREGRGETRDNWTAALVTYLRGLHAKAQLGAVASQQEHRELVPVTVADMVDAFDVTKSALTSATQPRPSAKTQPPEPSEPKAAGAAE